MLKEKFIVELEGSKHEILFGKNKDDNIGQYIRYADINNSYLTSYKVIDKGFKEGKWFKITDKDTSDAFKADYNKRKEEFKIEETKQFYKDVLKNALRTMEDLSEEDKNKHMNFLNNASYEELEKLFNSLMKNVK